MNKVNLFFFCYKTETSLLMSSIKMAHAIFGERRLATHVLYDVAAPLTYEDQELLRNNFGNESLVIAPTYYNRNRNQHGQDCILGMLKCMNKYCSNNSIAVKIDPDTLVFDTSYVDKFDFYKNIVFSASFRQHPHYAMGLTYAIDSKILNELIQDVEQFPAHHEALENFEIGQRIFRLFGEQAVNRIFFSPESDGAFYIGEPHQLPTKEGNIERQLMRLGAYSCGWTYNATAQKDQPNYRKMQADFMRKAVTLKLTNTCQNSSKPSPTDCSEPEPQS